MSQELDERFIAEIKSSIAARRRESVKKTIEEMRPADVADLVEYLDQAERLYIFGLLEPVGAGEVLVEIESPVQESILSDLDTQAISEIVEVLDSDDAADLVGDLPDERAREIIEHLGDDTTEELEKLLPYPEDSAGGIMALEFVAANARATVQQGIDLIRENREKVENLYYLYVVNDSRQLIGVISLKDLVVEPPERLLKAIMNPDVISVEVRADQEEVAQLVRKYNLVNIPVVDERRRLVGCITHDDIIDVIEEEVDEDISLMAGVISQEIAEESFLRISRARLPWLVAGLLGGVLAAVVINQFESSLERVLALSFFFPVIMAMGGNTGTQAATVAVRGMATGDIGFVNIGRRIWVEVKVALVNGIVCGILLGLIVGVWLSDAGLGLIVAFSLVLIVLNSGFIGAAVPLALRRLHIDPALATGPFVTTSNDILSLLIYLGLVTLFLRMTS